MQKTPEVSAAVMHSVLEDILVEIVGANVDAPHQIDRPTDAHSPLHSLIILRTHPPFTTDTACIAVSASVAALITVWHVKPWPAQQSVPVALFWRKTPFSVFSMSPNRLPSR